MGRPKGQPNKEFTLAPVAERLGELLGGAVIFAQSDRVVDDGVVAAVSAMKDGEILLLENTRYREEETKNDPAFSQELAQLGEIFVNDAFGTAHRAHCSTAGVAEFMLLANETVAREFSKKNAPFVYRVHDKPAREKMEEFQTFLKGVGIGLNGSPENISPKQLHDIADCDVEGVQNHIDTEIAYEFGVCRTAYLRDNIFDPAVLGHQCKQQVILVESGCSNKSIHIVDAFFFKETDIGTVAVEDHYVFEVLGQIETAFLGTFDYLDGNVEIGQHLCKIETGLSAADDHNFLQIGILAFFMKKCARMRGCFFRILH